MWRCIWLLMAKLGSRHPSSNVRSSDLVGRVPQCRTPLDPDATVRKRTVLAIARDRRLAMTSKSDFTTEEWQLILEGPPGAGMIVVTAQRGGSFRETIAMAKAYAEARQQHGESELLDEIVAAKPERDP